MTSGDGDLLLGQDFGEDISSNVSAGVWLLYKLAVINPGRLLVTLPPHQNQNSPHLSNAHHETFLRYTAEGITNPLLSEK